MSATQAPLASRVEMPILGMRCASCAGRIEGALAQSPEVSRAAVNFATGRATVEFDPEATGPERLREVVRGIGYDALTPAP